MAKFIVAISYEGVTLSEQYDSLNGQYFKGLVERDFGRIFRYSNEGASKLFIQDEDPSQNSTLARAAWMRVGAKLMPIPPRSPDINPIENIFNIVKRILRQDALRKNITYETFEEFSQSVANTITNLNRNLINKRIASMNNRIDLIIKKKGLRTNY